MKSKPNRLQAALSQKAQGTLSQQPETAKEGPAPERKPATRAGKTTRVGKVMVSGWLPIEARASCRLILAHHPDKLMQDLVEEAFNDLFAKYNVPQTARLTPTAKAS